MQILTKRIMKEHDYNIFPLEFFSFLFGFLGGGAFASGQWSTAGKSGHKAKTNSKE